MKFFAVGFLFVLILSVTLAMSSHAQDVTIAGLKTRNDGPSCHGRQHNGPRHSSSTPSTDADTTSEAETESSSS